jgi:hypothetical protein
MTSLPLHICLHSFAFRLSSFLSSALKRPTHNKQRWRELQPAAMPKTNTRQLAVSRSIHHALLHDPEREVVTRYNVFTVFVAFFSIWHMPLIRISGDLFKSLRNDVWKLDEVEYIESFLTERKAGALRPIGDLGYSGSVMNNTFLIKNISLLRAIGRNLTKSSCRHSSAL